MTKNEGPNHGDHLIAIILKSSMQISTTIFRSVGAYFVQEKDKMNVISLQILSVLELALKAQSQDFSQFIKAEFDDPASFLELDTIATDSILACGGLCR